MRHAKQSPQSMFFDLKYAIRSLFRSPGFSLTGVPTAGVMTQNRDA